MVKIKICQNCSRRNKTYSWKRKKTEVCLRYSRSYHPSYSLHFISSHINPLYSFFLLVENCFIASGPNTGMKCVLPFTLLQKTYNDCTTDWGLGNNGKPWCSTKGSMGVPDIMGGHYGDCGQECPIKKSN